jgi:amidase
MRRNEKDLAVRRLTRDHKIYFLDPENPPAISTESGEELIVETWDAFEGTRDAAVFAARTNIGPAIGPIHVRGAEPGDALRVEFLSVTPRAAEGAAHMIMAGRGFLNTDFPEPHCTPLVIDGDAVVFPGGLRIPMRPSMGFVATTPTYRQSTASDSGPYGGDIDMQELVSGSTLWLPVFVPGGMLAMGDCHALACDGAVAGTAAECAADTHIRVTVERGANLAAPRALTPSCFATLAYGPELGPAMRQAVRQMVDFLVHEQGMDPLDAYTLLSLAADIRLSRTFRDVSSVKLLLARSVLAQIEAR